MSARALAKRKKDATDDHTYMRGVVLFRPCFTVGRHRLHSHLRPLAASAHRIKVPTIFMQGLGRRRLHTHLRPLVAGAHHAKAPTIFVQGFLTGPDDEARRRWAASHAKIQDDSSFGDRHIPWGAAYLYPWDTGSEGDRLGRFPLPFASAALWVARRARVTPASIAASILTDATANAGRMYYHYRAAEARLDEQADRLAQTLEMMDLAEEGAHGYRVVGHSLGAALLLKALPRVRSSRRPFEVHLCAAAATEAQARPWLEHSVDVGTRECPLPQTYVYYADTDEILTTAFRYLIARDGTDAIGCQPLQHAYSGVRNVDVAPYLTASWSKHAAFAPNFHRYYADAIRGRRPSPTLKHASGTGATGGSSASSWGLAEGRWLQDALSEIVQQARGRASSASAKLGFNRWRLRREGELNKRND